MPKVRLVLQCDTSELCSDLDAIESGEMELPTVSAIAVLVDDVLLEEVPVYLE